MPPTVLITRPSPGSQHFADQLRERVGHDLHIVISPLMQITFLDEVLALDEVQSLIFSSRNGVEAYARLSDRRDLPCYAVGQATQAAAQAIGLSAIDAGGDVTGLYKRIIDDGQTGPLLHLHGAHVAGDLMGQLSAAGCEARDQVIYRQGSKPLSNEAKELLSRDNMVILPLFSPRTADLFFDDAPCKAPLLVAAISDNAAEKVPKQEVLRLIVADKPDAAAMLEATETLLDDANRLEGAKRAQ